MGSQLLKNKNNETRPEMCTLNSVLQSHQINQVQRTSLTSSDGGSERLGVLVSIRFFQVRGNTRNMNYTLLSCGLRFKIMNTNLMCPPLFLQEMSISLTEIVFLVSFRPFQQDLLKRIWACKNCKILQLCMEFLCGRTMSDIVQCSSILVFKPQ